MELKLHQRYARMMLPGTAWLLMGLQPSLSDWWMERYVRMELAVEAGLELTV
jgi:hypothetical protein